MLKIAPNQGKYNPKLLENVYFILLSVAIESAKGLFIFLGLSDEKYVRIGKEYRGIGSSNINSVLSGQFHLWPFLHWVFLHNHICFTLHFPSRHVTQLFTNNKPAQQQLLILFATQRLPINLILLTTEKRGGRSKAKTK